MVEMEHVQLYRRNKTVPFSKITNDHSRSNEPNGSPGPGIPRPHVVRIIRTIGVTMPAAARALASKIELQLQAGDYSHCAVYEDELEYLWPQNDNDRQAKIARFAKYHGFRLRFYRKGQCAIFDKEP